MVTPADRDMVRRLAGEVARIAGLAVQGETMAGWKRVNRLGKGRAMVYAFQVPWHEMEVDGELALQCADPFCRGVEEQMRRIIYQWKHFPGDMVVEGKWQSWPAIRDTGFGIRDEEDIARTDARNDIVGHRFHVQIRDEGDLEKIKTPRVSFDAAATEAQRERLADLFGDILPVEVRGVPGFWFTPWDDLVKWLGPEEVLLDLVDRPEFIHAAMKRMVDAWLARLEQYERLGLLALNNGNTVAGSGGLSFVDELPGAGWDPGHVRAMDLWGNASAQPLNAVSPAMHEEFAVRHEMRWLEKFGLNCYGCCEALHHKVGILRQIPRLRRIAMSPWIDVEEAVKNVGDRYVFSYKPSPAILADGNWSAERVRREMGEFFAKTRGCVVEVVMKDISTVGYEPRRLWEWSRIVKEMAEEWAER